MERQEGYYWIKNEDSHNAWVPALWSESDNDFLYRDCWCKQDSSYVPSEINENRIPEPNDKAYGEPIIQPADNFKPLVRYVPNTDGSDWINDAIFYLTNATWHNKQPANQQRRDNWNIKVPSGRISFGSCDKPLRQPPYRDIPIIDDQDK